MFNKEELRSWNLEGICHRRRGHRERRNFKFRSFRCKKARDKKDGKDTRDLMLRLCSLFNHGLLRSAGAWRFYWFGFLQISAVLADLKSLGKKKPQRFSPFPVVFIREHGLPDNRASDGNVSWAVGKWRRCGCNCWEVFEFFRILT